MRLLVVGNPDNRRVGAFTDAVRAAGLPSPRLVSWRQVLTDPAALRFGAGTLVRIESPGEDAEVDRLLRGADRPAEAGEIVGGRAWYTGFGQALDRLAALAASDGVTLLNDPRDIKIMFDKAACHQLLSAAAVPVPAALFQAVVSDSAELALAADGAGTSGWAPAQGVRDAAPSAGWTGVRQAMRDVGWRRVFVKPRHGSSASGVIALALGPAGRMQAMTSVEIERRHPASPRAAAESCPKVRLFNSLRVRTYRDEREIATIVDALAPDGLHVERWFPKAGLHGRTIDLRVVVIAGRASHVVVRAGTGPMTNLHLGGARGDLAALRAMVGSAAYAAALDSCERAAACFSGSLHVGVDLMFAPDFRRHAIAEVNAFGDLLPGLLVNGRDSYAAEIAALVRGWAPTVRERVPAERPQWLEVTGAEEFLHVSA